MDTPTPPQPSRLARIFLSPQEKRPRAGWRLLAQFLLLVLFVIAAGLPALIILVLLETFLYLPETISFQIINSLTLLLAVIPSVYIARRWIDRRTFNSLGLDWNPKAARDLYFGIALSGLQMGGIYLVEWAAGWLDFTGFAWQSQPVGHVLIGLLLMLAVFIVVGWQEELLTRGYWLQNLEQGLNLPWAVLLSSILFGLLHLFNPEASWASTLGLVAAGLFLAYPYLRTRQLWLSIGLHIGWNFFEGVIFGFPVSGMPTFRLIKHQVSGPEIWTGGAFGPEAGLIVLPALALGALLIRWYTRKS